MCPCPGPGDLSEGVPGGHDFADRGVNGSPVEEEAGEKHSAGGRAGSPRCSERLICGSPRGNQLGESGILKGHLLTWFWLLQAPQSPLLNAKARSRPSGEDASGLCSAPTLKWRPSGQTSTTGCSPEKRALEVAPLASHPRCPLLA